MASSTNSTSTKSLSNRGSLIAHIAVLVLGTCFLLIDAFHGNVWFDESYSIGIVKHSFAEIWDIGSGDVHPVLFYWALHVLYLIFGQNITIYRIFTVAGSVALAALGLTHFRRDFGARVGIIFTFLALFIPYVAQMSVEIRMYSWATFTVTLCALYAYRIVACLCNTVPKRIAEHASRRHLWAGVPTRWWITFALASLASCYLQYYGTMSAFMINLLLLLFLLSNPRKHARALGVFAILAVIQVGLFVPWLVVAVFSQVGVVSNTYWAKLSFPNTFIELITYPMNTSQISFALRGQYGFELQAFLIALQFFTLALFIFFIVYWVKRLSAKRKIADSTEKGDLKARLLSWARKDNVAPFLGALFVYLAVFLFALVASIVMDSLIIYYRYLFVTIGPFLLFASAILAYIRPKPLCYLACAVVLATSVVNMACLVRDDYDPENQDALIAFEEASHESDLIVSSDIGFMGVTSVLYPDIHQTYMDWQKGNWGKAYLAYSPTMESKKSWELIFDDYHGTFVCLGQSQKNELPRDISDLSQKSGFTLVEYETFYRPYERTWFTIAIMTKE